MIVGGIRNWLKVPNLFFWSLRRPCKKFSFSPSGLFLVKSEVHPQIYHNEGWRWDIRHCLKFQTYSLGNSGCHAKFQNRSFTPSRLLLVSDKVWKVSVRTCACDSHAHGGKNLENWPPWGLGGFPNFLFTPNLIFFVSRNSVKNFKVVAQLLVGYFWLVMKKIKIKELLILIATLATTEVSVGALAKADQK